MEPQQSDAEAHDAAPDAKLDQHEPQQAAAEVEFDAEGFAALLKNQLIAYSFSWAPLTTALESLAASMAKQQRAQQGTSSAVDEMREQLEAMRERLDQSNQHEQEAASAVAQLQGQVGVLSSELEQAKQDQQAHKDEIEKLKDERGEVSSASNSGRGGAGGEEETTPAAAAPVYASADDLKHVKQTLTNQLRKSLSAVFGEQFVVNDGDEDDEEALAGGEGGSSGSSASGVSSVVESAGPTDAPLARPPSRPGTGVSGVLRTPLPGVPFASEAMVKAELDKLRELQAALDAKLAAQTRSVGTLDDKVDSLDARVDAATAALQQRRNSTPVAAALTGPSTEALQRQIDELNDQQTALLQQLKDQAQAVDKQASGLKELVATLDDLTLQQQMMQSAQPASGSETSASSAAEGAATSGGGSMNTTGPPQLDLSLVFTKIADLRRATDASIDQLQQRAREAADSTATQQAQLDALRQAAVFNELQKLRLMEARLALQKELLGRNQTHQDRTKPQLAEWKKQLEQTEDKLHQGLCDHDTMDEMQQLQRNYHRTMLTLAPLINSPLLVTESLQELSDEVKDLAGGMQGGAVAVLLGGSGGSEGGSGSGGNGGGGGGSARGDRRVQRVDDVATKLQYLDEEVAATQQVNVVTEKKNDPLLKSLDTMRDKLERMWSLWHQNLINKKRADAEALPAATTPRSTAGSTAAVADAAVVVAIAAPPTVTSDGLRDLELRLLGAVRRINSLEEEVDRLGALASASVSGSATGAASRSGTDEVIKLRKEMQEEIQRLSLALANLQALSSSSSSSTPPDGGHAASHSPEPASPSRGDLVGDLHAQMRTRGGGGRDLDGRFHGEGGDDASGGGGGAAHASRTTYDALLKDLTKKVTQAVVQHVDKTGGVRGGGPAGVGANPNVNFRTLLENFTQKFDDRLEDNKEFTVEELAKLRKELLELLKGKLEASLRDLRAEFMMIYYPSAGSADSGGDSTAVGTKPVMCVACSRPVPVSGMIREPGAYPSAELLAEQTNALLHAELEYDRSDEDFVYRAGFKMPADRKSMTLPFLATNIRNRIALNKIDRKPRRPARHTHANPVDSIVREAMELDRKQRHLHGMPPSPPK